MEIQICLNKEADLLWGQVRYK